MFLKSCYSLAAASTCSSQLLIGASEKGPATLALQTVAISTLVFSLCFAAKINFVIIQLKAAFVALGHVNATSNFS